MFTWQPWQVEFLARNMFARQAATYVDDPCHAQRIWEGDAGVRDFWRAEATAVLELLAEAT